MGLWGALLGRLAAGIFALFCLSAPAGNSVPAGDSDSAAQCNSELEKLNDHDYVSAKRSVEELLEPPTRYFGYLKENPYQLPMDRGKVRDQCAYGSCWAHATLAVFEARAKKRGEPVTLSEDYLIYVDLLEKARHAINAPGSVVEFPRVQEGTTIEKVAAQIENYGLIPLSRFRSRINFKKYSVSATRMIFNLNALIGLLRDKIAKASPQREKRQREGAFQEVEKYLQSYFGKPPDTFEYRGRQFTPLTFWDQPLFEPQKEGGFVSVDINPRDTDRIAKAIRKQLDETGEPVRISLHWAPVFIDQKTGVMSITAYDMHNLKPEFLTYLAKEDKDVSGHAMVIVNYALREGKIDRFLVRNSWGEDDGSRGHYHLYLSYFEHLGVRARLYKAFMK